jgi:hypothetical protein
LAFGFGLRAGAAKIEHPGITTVSSYFRLLGAMDGDSDFM